MSKEKQCPICELLGKDVCKKLEKETVDKLSKTLVSLFDEQMNAFKAQVDGLDITDKQKKKAIDEYHWVQFVSLVRYCAACSVHMRMDLGSFIAGVIDEFRAIESRSLTDYIQNMIDENYIHEIAQKGGKA